MFNKKIIMILTIILVSLFAVSAVSAAENSTGDVVSMYDGSNAYLNIDGRYEELSFTQDIDLEDLKSINKLDNCESNNSNEVISISNDESIVSGNFNSNYDYKDLYLDDVDAYYDDNSLLMWGWVGYFEGKLVIYHHDSIIFSKKIGGHRIGGSDMDDCWLLHYKSGKPVPVGVYTAKLFSKDGKVLKTAKIKISKSPTDLLVDSKTTKAGKKVTIKNIVMGDCGRADTAKGKITLKINGKSYSTNVKNGKFSISFKAPSKAKKYTCKVTYGGDSNYKGSSYKFNLIVKAPAKKKTTTKKKTTKKKSKSKYKIITATPKLNKYIVKRLGKYAIGVELWNGPSGNGGLNIFAFKNGKRLWRNNYYSRVYYKNGRWAWTSWSKTRGSEIKHMYHKANRISVAKVQIKVHV